LSHEIVLLLHQSRAIKVKKYYEKLSDGESFFKKPFIIIEFNRSNESKPYFFFRIVSGILSDNELNSKLELGVPVPMNALLSIYSTIKIYDSQPPLPLMLELIWTNVVLNKAIENPKFPSLTKRQKIEVILDIDEIVDKLYNEFSFKILHGNNTENQLKVPQKEWIVEACEKLIKFKEAKWSNSSKTQIVFFFKKYQKVLEHFSEVCSNELNDENLSLFKQ
jgi:hypothetical protein